MDDFNSSIHFDQRLYKQDIKGSMAHAAMLGKQGVIPQEDADLIVKTLGEILQDIEDGKVEFRVDAEDIHMNVETLLIERIGDVGKRLHTGRSRNDQVALDFRMYVMDAIKEIQDMLTKLEETILTVAEANLDTILPGYTHLQRAQPITLAHHMMAYYHMFRRDIDRLSNCYQRTDSMPLGSGALAGTTYPLDRAFVAEQLGFSKVTDNSLDGVSDRDFAIEFCSAMSLIMMHLSRFSEEMVLWSSLEFGFVEMDDAYSTGSSIMPQKKNPDVAELVRGKTGRVYGDLMGLLTVMKGLPLAYNKDMQEDKEAVFDAVDTGKMCIDIFTRMLSTCRFKKETMYKAASKGFTNATDFADYLVKKGTPFRTAHEITGRLVLECLNRGIGIEDLSLAELKELGGDFIEADVYEAISLKTCVEGRKLTGGPAPDTVKADIEKAKAEL
jgi:argininosuccinate lyase